MNDRPLIRRRTLIAGSAAALGASGLVGLPVSAASDPRTTGGATRLRTLDYRGVRLLSSRWQTQQSDVLSCYLNVPDDNYLKGFRRRAGRPDPGAELGGWYSDDVFHCFGQIVSGLARLYAATGRVDVRAKVHALVAGFTACVEDDGWFFYSRQPNARHYIYDKVVCGLLDAYLYAGVESAPATMRLITDWAYDPVNLDRSNVYAWESSPTEWYTLSENLYRAQLATGDSRFGEFARVWEYRGFWDHFAQDENWFRRPDGTPYVDYHAYSHVNTLSGLGAGYLATGDSYYLTALANAYDAIRETQVYATGGYGPWEHFLDDTGVLRRAIARGHWHFETQCGSWAVFKIAKYLLRITGDARFGDWAEQIVYNGVGASMQNTPDGNVQYFSDYSSRGGTKFVMNPWSCCSGTRPQAVADYTDLVFLVVDDELCVNLFLPASVQTQLAGGTLRARLETTFPDSDTIRLRIEAAPASPVAVRFRSPGWLAHPARLEVNGKAIHAAADWQNWIGTRRRWSAGDVITLTVPTGSRLIPFDPDHNYPAALAHGPVVLAAVSAPSPAVLEGGPAAFRRVGPGLRYRAGHTVLEPYYIYRPGVTYYLYLDPQVGSAIRYLGTWNENVVLSYTKTAGSAAEWSFEGTGFRWQWRQFDDAGVARVYVDGDHVREVDQYGPQRDVPASSWFGGLPDRTHTVRVECSGTKRPESVDVYLNVVDFEGSNEPVTR